MGPGSRVSQAGAFDRFLVRLTQSAEPPRRRSCSPTVDWSMRWAHHANPQVNTGDMILGPQVRHYLVPRCDGQAGRPAVVQTRRGEYSHAGSFDDDPQRRYRYLKLLDLPCRRTPTDVLRPHGDPLRYVRRPLVGGAVFSLTADNDHTPLLLFDSGSNNSEDESPNLAEH